MDSPPGEGEEQDVEAALLARAEDAVLAAVQIRNESEVLPAAAVAVEQELPLRCAWCGRYCVDEHWVVLEGRAPPVRATHGICEDCLHALRDRGLSV
jgi:hypothetical protein